MDSEITVLGAPSSMTDYTIFSCLPRAIFFFKLGTLASGLHLTKVQPKAHTGFKELAIATSISESAQKGTHSKTSVSKGNSILITYVPKTLQTVQKSKEIKSH